LELVRIYEEELQSVDKARELLKRLCEDWGYRFRRVEDMATCHAAWIEMELRHEQWEEALSLARQAVSPPAVVDSANAKIAKALPKSLRLWDLLLDLEESLGTVATTKDAYNRAMELKVATPMHVLDYCSFLKDKKYLEESFGAFERGLELFQFPGAKVLWMSYLQNFIERYQGTKVERVRDLFERCFGIMPSR
jgi:pre-mRNA-splicing factor SYF1